MPCILFAAPEAKWPAYHEALTNALAQHDIAASFVTPWQDRPADPAGVDYIIYDPEGPVRDFSPYTNARAVLSLWAGVERIVGDASITQPLCRMVDDGLERGMVEWVCGHVLRHHLDIDFFLAHQNGDWQGAQHAAPLARDRRVTVLGLGALGTAAAQALAGLGFDTCGWSRRPKQIDGLQTCHGPDGLEHVLRRADILVTILPQTPQTTGLLNHDTLAWMPEGAVVINPGRGSVLVDNDLLRALDRGHLAHATLDVFTIEPLPETHPFWAHPKITVTPHIAAQTRPDTSARVIAENIRRGEAGEPLLHLVDRAQGY